MALTSSTSGALGPGALDRRADAPRSTLPLLALLCAVTICTAPSLMVLIEGLTAGPMQPGARALFGDAVAATAVLVIAAGAVSAVLGASAAWLVTMYRFPGRCVFEWLLVLPLAAPVYVLAYAYGALTGPTGPFPIRLSGLTGAGFVYVLGFYPYVYLAARAAFVAQSVCVLEAARTLGASPWRAFWSVALPNAWPGIAAGVALACMEIAADYGAASYFGATTVTTGIFRAWFSRGDPALAMQMASLLLIAALALMVLERQARGRRRFDAQATRWRDLPRMQLPAPLAVCAVLFCATLVILGAVAPLAWLARLALLHAASDLADLVGPLLRTLALAGVGTCLTVLLSILIAAAAQGGRARAAPLAAAMGYAAPGAVTALGALLGYSALREAGLVTGLGGGVAIGALLWVYASRFASPAVQTIEAGLTKITPHISDAARTLGASRTRKLVHIDLPIAAPGVISGALIVFVEIMKELPATLVLRPFDFETLAVRANAYAADERLTHAALPALMITLAGLIPVIVLSRRLSTSRAGDAP